ALRPADRYGGALELAADVEHWLGDEPVSALPGSVWTRAGRWARRHLAIVSGVSAATLVLGISLGIGVALLAEHDRKLSDANQETRQAVHQFFTDVSENRRLLRKEPGTQQLRRELLTRAWKYYEDQLKKHA